MDLVVHAPGAKEPIYIDVSIVSALSVEALRGGSASQDGKAAELAAKHKHNDYPLINLTPFIVEDHGRLGTEALAFVRRIAPIDLSARSKAIRDLYQRLGSVLQRKAADAVLAAIGGQRAAATDRR